MRYFLQSSRNKSQIYEVLAYNDTTKELKLDGMFVPVYTTKPDAARYGYRPIAEDDPAVQAWLRQKQSIKDRGVIDAKFTRVQEKPPAGAQDDAGAGGADEPHAAAESAEAGDETWLSPSS